MTLVLPEHAFACSLRVAPDEDEMNGHQKHSSNNHTVIRAQTMSPAPQINAYTQLSSSAIGSLVGTGCSCLGFSGGSLPTTSSGHGQSCCTVSRHGVL